MITAFVSGQNLTVRYPVIVSGTIDYLEAQFVFQTSDWDGAVKWAHFKKGNADPYDVMLVNDKITKDKHLNLSEGEWEVYLHGTKGGEQLNRLT